MPLDHTLQTAIIGAGLMGEWHARYASRCGVWIVSVVDPDASRAQALAAKFPRATAYSTLAACLDQSDARVAHVCAPTDQHFALCSQALGAGFHSLVEKPAASDALLTEQLLTLARNGNRCFGGESPSATRFASSSVRPPLAGKI